MEFFSHKLNCIFFISFQLKCLFPNHRLFYLLQLAIATRLLFPTSHAILEILSFAAAHQKSKQAIMMLKKKPTIGVEDLLLTLLTLIWSTMFLMGHLLSVRSLYISAFWFLMMNIKKRKVYLIYPQYIFFMLISWQYIFLFL